MPSDSPWRYAYDVDPISQAFKNRRVFSYVDSGVPDGIQLDSAGNVYAATGEGVQVLFLNTALLRLAKSSFDEGLESRGKAYWEDICWIRIF